ncbi:hypothetical protein F4U94_22805 [Sphingobium limneticum]|uniref:hypothetical protein n=1 Tax=Sphingobium limneticum TaxID=1007511 RepID=UPI00123DAC0F|nr:hypothetical protein [Sphingobium limneticum]KAA9009657.1 hypothetical protein F4U94_22805 [Sphingobium limneticum]
MIVLDNVVGIRPADNIVAMLRDLADEIEQVGNVANVFIVIEHESDDDTDVRCYGPSDCAYRAAGVLTKAVRDLLP